MSLNYLGIDLNKSPKDTTHVSKQGRWYRLSGSYFFHYSTLDAWIHSRQDSLWLKENLIPIDFIRYAKNIGATDIDYHAAPSWIAPKVGTLLDQKVSVVGKYCNSLGVDSRIIKMIDGSITTIAAEALRLAEPTEAVDTAESIDASASAPAVGSLCEIIDSGKVAWDANERYLIGTKVLVMSVFESDDSQVICSVRESNGRHLCILAELLRPIALDDTETKEQETTGELSQQVTLSLGSDCDQSWNAECLPTVGTVCEGLWPFDTDPCWSRFEVKCIGEIIVLDFFDSEKYHTLKELQQKEAKFRIVKRPAQAHNEDTNPADWNGEGLPPVGTVCVAEPHNDQWGLGEAITAKVVAYFEDSVWLKDVDCLQCFYSTRMDKVEFIPIKTPEQMAKEELSEAVSEMVDIAFEADGSCSEMCARLYDAGYRKPE